MSTPAPPRSTGTLRSAQQQLDELDALIQRMLTLPTTAPEESRGVAPDEPPPVPPVEETHALEPAAVPTIDMPYDPASEAVLPPPVVDAQLPEILMAPPAPEPAETYAPFVPSAAEAFIPPTPAEIEMTEAQQTEPAFIELPEPAASKVSFAFPSEEDSADSEPLTVPSGWHGFLVRCNRIFDRCTYPMGFAGYWLRSSFGRTVLGWTGIVLLAGSICWAILDWFGWT